MNLRICSHMVIIQLEISIIDTTVRKRDKRTEGEIPKAWKSGFTGRGVTIAVDAQRKRERENEGIKSSH